METAPVPNTSPDRPPKKREDDNWRVSRSVKSAKRKADKAIAARDVAQEACVDSQAKLLVAENHIKRVEHEQYLNKKAHQLNALHRAEEHQHHMSVLMEKFQYEIESAHAETESVTNKCLEEEAIRIESERNHSQELRKERCYCADKIKTEQSKLAKERSGQAAIIDHLHEQWNDKMAATKLKMEENIEVCIRENEKR